MGKTLAAPMFQTELIERGNTMTVAVSSGSALVERFFGSVQIEKTLVTVGSQVFGPYAFDVSIKVSCLSGLCDLDEQPFLAAFDRNEIAALFAQVQSSSVSGLTLTNTQNTRAMRAGGKRGRVLLLGDSFLQGFSSGGSSLFGTAQNGPAEKVAARLNAAGIPARASWMQGWPSLDTKIGAPSLVVPANISLIDARVSITACDIFDNFHMLGGWPVQLGTAGADAFVFRPGCIFDTVEILHARASSLGNFNVAYTGGSQVVNDFNATSDVFKTVLTVPQGTSSVTISKGSASSFISALGVRQSTRPDVEVICASVTGMTLQQLARTYTFDASNTWNVNRGLPVLIDANASNLVVLDGWFNDWGVGRSVAQVQADLTAIITQCKGLPNTDVMFIDYAQADASVIPSATAELYRAAVRSTCVAQNVAHLDLRALLPNFASSSAQGLFGDAAHLNGQGHAYTAGLIVSAITKQINN